MNSLDKDNFKRGVIAFALGMVAFFVAISVWVGINQELQEVYQENKTQRFEACVTAGAGTGIECREASL